jgi:hypothetical protein
MNVTEVIWTVIGFFLTLCVFSYIFGDNILFRFASYLLIGVSAGYLMVIIFYKVLIPKIVIPFSNGNPVQKTLVIIPLVLGTLLLFKLSPRLARLGNVSMGYLVGAGAAVLIGGVIFGTLFPQTGAAVAAFGISGTTVAPGIQILGAVILLVGTVTSLAYFQFGMRGKSLDKPRQSKIMALISKVGQVFIAITLGALFTGSMLAALTALIERLGSLWTTITLLLH